MNNHLRIVVAFGSHERPQMAGMGRVGHLWSRMREAAEQDTLQFLIGPGKALRAVPRA